MGFFGKNEDELKQIATDLNKRQTDLDNRESTVKSAESNIEHEKKLLENEKAQIKTEKDTFLEEAKNDREDIASEKAELEKRRIEILKLEAVAKAGFVEKQREAFKEVIAKRIAELDARQQDLVGMEEQLSVKLKNMHTTEGEIAKRELGVTEREQKAGAGFADKAKALADEAARQHQANQVVAELLRKHADAIAEERQSLEVAKAGLVQREQTIIAAEQKRDAGFADERASLDGELRAKRSKVELEIAGIREKTLSAYEDEIAKLKTKRLEEITTAEQSERNRIRAEIANERAAWTKQQEDNRKQLGIEWTELEQQKGVSSALRSELEGRRIELEANERTLERKDQRLEQQWQKRNAELDDVVEARLEEERTSLEVERQSGNDENTRLRESIRIQTGLVGAFDQLKRQLGDKDPEEIIRDLNSKTDELKRVREELATRPTEEMREKYEEMDSEIQRLKARIAELVKQINTNEAAIEGTADLRRKNGEMDAENKSLAQKAFIFEGDAKDAKDEINRLQAELKRLRAAYERPAEVADRHNEIEMPYIKADKAKQPAKPAEAGIDELTWLKGVGNDCDIYGLHFNPRILKAFHTALKTAEWSPLTVLGGVSGTGKSELPRLYSHFGGLLFEPLSVQPNWDSQESMLGFFNSIDNKFDAQPVLRFLAQSQKPWRNKTNDDEGYPGLKDCVCLVLLDEMNLAHPELYFAEFLSKLELRRGMKGTDVPFLPVKIGAGLPPYQLPLGRNVLWAGTMNQDETTKSLSDKVLDRSIIIHFPRPTELKRRLNLAPLDEKNRGPLLHKDSWQNWLALGSSFSEDDVKPFKDLIQDMNAALAVTGHAIGHRVWQSVEYYMANYPDVRLAQKEFINKLKAARAADGNDNGDNVWKPVEYFMTKYSEVRDAHDAIDKNELAKALHIAFEDQLVQKVMPKLRGIDTRGKSKTDCLDKILDKINKGIGGNPFNLAEDFDLACELGYGQFIWQSANYLREDECENPSHSSSMECEVSDESNKSGDEPPPEYRPADPDRAKRWGKMSHEKRNEWKANYEKRPQ